MAQLNWTTTYNSKDSLIIHKVNESFVIIIDILNDKINIKKDGLITETYDLDRFSAIDLESFIISKFQGWDFLRPHLRTTPNARTINNIVSLAETTAKKVLTEAGLLPPFIALNQACKLYGEGNVKRWISEGLIKPIKDGDKNSKIRIDRVQIATIAHTSNRASWYEHHLLNDSE